MGLLDLYSWVESTGKMLEGGRASNFYYDKEAGIVIVKFQGLSELLVIEGGRRIHLSSRTTTPKEYKPYPLVVLLRKTLRGKRVEVIRPIGSDRIVEIKFITGHRIVAELVPRGIVALVSPDGKVLASDKSLKVKDRVIKPGVQYVGPPQRGSIVSEMCLGRRLTADVIKNCSEKGKDLVRGLIRGCGVQGEAAEEAIIRAGLSLESSPKDLSDNEWETLASTLWSICSESLEGRGYLVLRGGEPVEATPFKPLRYSGEDFDVKEYDRIDEALDILFSKRPTTTAVRGEKEDSEVERLVKSIRRAEERARQYKTLAEELRRSAVLIGQRYDEVEKALRSASKGSPSRVEGLLEAYPGGREVKVRVMGVEVSLPRGSGPDRLIVEIYKRAGEMEAKAKRALEVRGQMEERLAELRLKAKARSIAERIKRRRRYWFEKYHWTVTRNGFLAIGGRDAQQNEAVVKRYLEEGDLFLHASIHGAPAVVLKTKGRKPGPEDIWDAAVLTAAYSKAWKSGLGSVEVYWAESSQVSFSPPSGEYLAKGGIMVYGRKHYLERPVPIRLALGVALNEEETPIVFQGSPETVEEKTVAYAILAPGDLGKEEAAELLRRKLAEAAGATWAPHIYAVPLQEIMPRIPGRARLISVRRGRGEQLDLSRYA